MFRVSEAGSLMESVVITVLTCQHLVSYLHFTCHLHIIKIYTSPNTSLDNHEARRGPAFGMSAVAVCTFAKIKEDQSNWAK